MSTFLGFGTGVFFGNTVRASTCLIADNLCSTSPGIVIQPIQGAGLGATHLLNSSATPVDVSTSAPPTAGQILTATGATNAVWMDNPGTGDVVGPGSSTDNAIVRFDGVTGKLIQNSNITIDDSGNFEGATIKTLASGTSLGRNSGNPPANSTFIGVDAGGLLTIGTNNTFIGTDTGFSTTTGFNNTFVGTSAGSGNTDGVSNTCIGFNAGTANSNASTYIGANAGSNSTGGSNTFVGSDAGNSNTLGVNNTFIGQNAGRSNTTGGENVFIGHFSGLNNATNFRNIYIGDRAGSSANATGCILIGSNAGSLNIISDRLMIDNTATGTNEPLIDGNFSFNTLQINGTVTLGTNGSTPTHSINTTVNDNPSLGPGGGEVPSASPVTWLEININGGVSPFYIPLYQ